MLSLKLRWIAAEYQSINQIIRGFIKDQAMGTLTVFEHNFAQLLTSHLTFSITGHIQVNYIPQLH